MTHKGAHQKHDRAICDCKVTERNAVINLTFPPMAALGDNTARVFYKTLIDSLMQNNVDIYIDMSDVLIMTTTSAHIIFHDIFTHLELWNRLHLTNVSAELMSFITDCANTSDIEKLPIYDNDYYFITRDVKVGVDTMINFSKVIMNNYFVSADDKNIIKSELKKMFIAGYEIAMKAKNKTVKDKNKKQQMYDIWR